MKTTPVTEHLTQLTKLHFVNAFLVREDDGFTLVDTTMGRSPKGLIERRAAREAAFAGSRSRTGTAITSACWTRCATASAPTWRC